MGKPPLSLSLHTTHHRPPAAFCQSQTDRAVKIDRVQHWLYTWTIGNRYSSTHDTRTTLTTLVFARWFTRSFTRESNNNKQSLWKSDHLKHCPKRAFHSWLVQPSCKWKAIRFSIIWYTRKRSDYFKGLRPLLLRSLALSNFTLFSDKSSPWNSDQDDKTRFGPWKKERN